MKKYGLIGKTLGHSFSKNYFAEKFASEGIDDVGVSALNLYVSEILYNYAYENDVQVNKNSVEKRIEDLSLQISEIINWGTYVKNASTIKKILSSES